MVFRGPPNITLPRPDTPRSRSNKYLTWIYLYLESRLCHYFAADTLLDFKIPSNIYRLENNPRIISEISNHNLYLIECKYL